jgi:acyl transferase domain-containing protein
MKGRQAAADLSGIAVIGMAGRFPGANSVQEFWRNLENGVESISFFTEAELIAAGRNPAVVSAPNYIRATGSLEFADQFDAAFFGFTPKEAAITDPQHRLFLECAWEALEVAGYSIAEHELAIGVYGGVGTSGYLSRIYADHELSQSVGAIQTMIGNEKDFLTTRVSYKLNLKGPSVNVQTACSTSLVAVHLACQGLLDGECDVALAGGVSVDAAQQTGYFYQEGGILSPDGHCRAFDARAQGTVRGCGVGIVVLKRLADAVADRDYIYAVIKGSATNNDGSGKVGFTAPSLHGQAEVITEALAVAGINPQTIS